MRYYVCTEAFAVTVFDNLEDEAEALRYGAMPQPEVEKLKEQAEKEGRPLKIPRGENKWFRAGQRVREDDRVFLGVSGANRMARMFLPENEEPSESFKRGPGRPRKESVEVNA